MCSNLGLNVPVFYKLNISLIFGYVKLHSLVAFSDIVNNLFRGIRRETR